MVPTQYDSDGNATEALAKLTTNGYADPHTIFRVGVQDGAVLIADNEGGEYHTQLHPFRDSTLPITELHVDGVIGEPVANAYHPDKLLFTKIGTCKHNGSVWYVDLSPVEALPVPEVVPPAPVAPPQATVETQSAPVKELPPPEAIASVLPSGAEEALLAEIEAGKAKGLVASGLADTSDPVLAKEQDDSEVDESADCRRDGRFAVSGVGTYSHYKAWDPSSNAGWDPMGYLLWTGKGGRSFLKLREQVNL